MSEYKKKIEGIAKEENHIRVDLVTLFYIEAHLQELVRIAHAGQEVNKGVSTHEVKGETKNPPTRKGKKQI